MPVSPSASQKLAAFAAQPDLHLPALARSRASDAITDCIGCMLAGLSEPVASIVAAITHEGTSGAPLTGYGRRVSPMDSALFHATIAHAIDFDDTNHPAYAHPSAVLVPALLAVADPDDTSGAAFVDAYVVGFQVFGKLGRALNFDHYRRGWHPTGTFGTLAAAVATGRVLRLDVQQLTMAIGIAASAASGLRVNFGSMVKPMHAGFAARNGVLAALLARNGMDASVAALDRDYGFFDVFGNGTARDLGVLEDWGEPPEILSPYGLALKPFPACGATHTAIEAALAVHDEIGGDAVESVTVHVTERALAPLIHVVPRTPLEAKFSMQFCVAAALCDGRVGLETFSERKIEDAAIRDLLPRISVVVDPSFGAAEEFPASVDVRTVSGERHERAVPLALGKPARWFSEGEMRKKFFDCTRRVLAETEADRLFRAVRAIDEAQSLGDIVGQLSRVRAPERS